MICTMAGNVRCRLKELPLDIFKTLLDNVINIIGVADGAKLRLICKLFDREIPGALYRCPDFRISNADWSPARPRVAEEYVLYRTLADGKRRHNLSARLHRVLEELLPEEDCFGPGYQDALRSLVTTAVHQGYGDRHIVELMDSRKSPTILDSTFRRDCLRAAAVLGVTNQFDAVVKDAASSEDQRYWSDRSATTAFDNGPLVYAAIGGQYQLIARILDAREAASRVNDSSEHESPLRLASAGGHRDIVKLLLDHGAMVTDYIQRFSSLSSAASHGHWEIVQDLLAAGSIPVHNQGFSPLMAAVRNGQVRAAEVLLDSGMELWYKDLALVTAAEKGYDTLVRLLVRRGANINFDRDSGTSPIMRAMKYGQPQLVRTLLGLGAKPHGPFLVSEHSGVLENWKYPRVERSGAKLPSA
ncbi:hypothetical protein IFR04_015678 [Cadophora malorum]|uniref:Ankyrin n=1 Tax=Cadophora malorum TaxID=108018 RepID=A0A8H7T0W0_9HELO|nr:hypothetical protein IFR04_015678 [Cadophora malorum]